MLLFDEDALKIGLMLMAKNMRQDKWVSLGEYSPYVRAFYRANLKLSEGGGGRLKNKVGTTLCRKYDRIVVGDYGAYVEIATCHINGMALLDRFPGKPSRVIKYIWKQTNDRERTRVYHQVGTVEYADYKPGFYYIAVEDCVCG